ncbi:TIM-barrel domain-containing protein, partial [Enterococcus faecium]|uniref:TIM-barrel domain-containing protein n=1 Tax=Enterococcus faecium TaxID=1352 RepID=UPI003CC56DAE
TEWEINVTVFFYFWITAVVSPKEIRDQYTSVTGRVPELPKKLLGLWQSKLRYPTPEEVLEVVDGYKQRGIQLSTIAID